MGSPIARKVKTGVVRAAVGVMPLVPLPPEWYRKVLVRDSEKRYATGRWAYMREIAESHRYSLIVGCSEFFHPGYPKVLDVGCGEGILQRRIKYSRYVGIDMNAEAIGLAKRNEDERTKFVLASSSEYQPQDRYDVIVFNESLYYMKDPIAIVQHYRPALAPGGILIVSMFQTNLARRIWRQLGKIGLTEITMTRIANELGFASIVRVYAEAAPESAR